MSWVQAPYWPSIRFEAFDTIESNTMKSWPNKLFHGLLTLSQSESLLLQYTAGALIAVIYYL